MECSSGKTGRPECICKKCVAHRKKASEAFGEIIHRCQKYDATFPPTSVYRYYDSDLNLIYVGISNDFESRHSQHFKKTDWIFDAYFVEVHDFPTRRIAEAVEERLIRRYSPRGNTKRTKVDPEIHMPEKWFFDIIGDGITGINFRFGAIAWTERPNCLQAPEIIFE